MQCENCKEEIEDGIWGSHQNPFTGEISEYLTCSKICYDNLKYESEWDGITHLQDEI